MAIDFEQLKFVSALNELARRSAHDFVDIDYLRDHEYMRETCKDWVVYDRESGSIVSRVDRDGTAHFYDDQYPGMHFGILRSAVGQRLKVMVTVSDRAGCVQAVIVDGGRWTTTEIMGLNR